MGTSQCPLIALHLVCTNMRRVILKTCGLSSWERLSVLESMLLPFMLTSSILALEVLFAYAAYAVCTQLCIFLGVLLTNMPRTIAFSVASSEFCMTMFACCDFVLRVYTWMPGMRSPRLGCVRQYGAGLERVRDSGWMRTFANAVCVFILDGIVREVITRRGVVGRIEEMTRLV
jgi:hypothetical protein